jgi:ABC-2 type transport system ATP-binding protein
LGGGVLRERVDQVLAWVGMSEAADRRVGGYSRGMRQRLGLAQALVHDPGVLILDEPTAGVDPHGVARMSRLIAALREAGKTVLITSHLIGQLAEICDAVAILDRGRVVFAGPLADFEDADRDRFEIAGALGDLDLEELRAWLAARGAALAGVRARTAGLERIYLERVGARGDA